MSNHFVPETDDAHSDTDRAASVIFVLTFAHTACYICE